MYLALVLAVAETTPTTVDWGEIIQAVLMTLIQVLLPFLIVGLLVLIRTLWQKYKAQLSVEQLTFITKLIENFVKAAEQQGLTGIISREGAAKKRWVIDRAEETLLAKGLKIDLDEISDLIESIYYDTIKRWKDEQTATTEAQKVARQQTLVAVKAVEGTEKIATTAVKTQAEATRAVAEATKAAEEKAADKPA